MNRIFASILALGFLVNCQSIPQTKDGKKLVWHDEFNYSGLPDSSKWNYDEGDSGFGNDEAEYYTKNRRENGRVAGGNLIIEARKENFGKSKYTSARLIAKGKFAFKYGTVEVRAKLPKGRGTWPAIWLLNDKMKEWPDDGELDIMEEVGYHPGFIHASAHPKKYNWPMNTQKTDTLEVKDASEKFHIYKADWSPEKIDIYVDDTKYFTYINREKTHDAWPFDEPFFLILNLAVGGNWGGKQGIDETIFPQKFLIDYVRIYQ